MLLVSAFYDNFGHYSILILDNVRVLIEAYRKAELKEKFILVPETLESMHSFFMLHICH